MKEGEQAMDIGNMLKTARSEAGMTQEKAKAIICAFIIHTHDRRAAASILHCGTCSIGVFMTNPQTIPRSVGKRVDSLAKILRLTLPKCACSEISKKTETAKNDENRNA